MNMNNGLAIIEVSDSQTRSVFIDQEALECARLNARIKKRVNKQRVVAKKCYTAYAKRRKRIAKTAVHVLLCTAVCVGVSLAGGAGLIAPVIWIPIGLLCICGACVRLGACFGRK